MFIDGLQNFKKEEEEFTKENFSMNYTDYAVFSINIFYTYSYTNRLKFLTTIRK